MFCVNYYCENKLIASLLYSDDTAQRIDNQTAAQTVQHQELSADLAQLHDSAQDVSSKLDASAEVFRELHAQTLEHYEQTLDNIRQVKLTALCLLLTG